ncbi:ABC transporter, permease protein [Streptococcus pseudoporcinus]|uniref:ABC transporter, permease protein n=1 Tax=Streptococcus pseudoporcinus TaxID=361101 RepID=A0A4U9ZC36_9STRE|nr:ABC transporter, permease protein [Streptococcus pseudoporcinus]
MKNNKKRKQTFWGLLFVAPTIIGLLILNIIPILQTLKMSFFKVGILVEETYLLD